MCGEQGGREGGRKALWGLGVSPQEGVLEAPLREGLLKLSGPWVPFSDPKCSAELQLCDSLPGPSNPLPVAGRAVRQVL